MALPKGVAKKIEIIALKDAASQMDDDVEEVESSPAECSCPKCGYSGPISEFQDAD